MVQQQLRQLQLQGLLGTADCAWLALQHITGLTSLGLPDARMDGSALPAARGGVRRLHGRGAALALRAPADVSVGVHASLLQSWCGSLRGQALVRLSILGQQLTAASLAAPAAATGLTCLELSDYRVAAGVACLASLAAALAPLRALRHLELQPSLQLSGEHDAAAQHAFAEAVGGLRQLMHLDLSRTVLGHQATAELAANTTARCRSFDSQPAAWATPAWRRLPRACRTCV